MTASNLGERVLALCERSGFISVLSKGSGGPSAVRYGPLGAELKRNIVSEWWHAVVTSMGNVFPVDTPIGTFDERILVDNEMSRVKNPFLLRANLNQAPLYNVYKKTLKTEIPFGIAEIGKAFRVQEEKEQTLKSQEVEMGVVSFFCSPSEQKSWASQWRKLRLKWWKKFAANPEKFTLGEGEESDRELLGAIEFQFPEGPSSVETMVTKEAQGKSDPCVISLSTSIDRAVWAYICDSFTESLRPHEVSSSETSTVMRLDPCLAPYKVAVMPRINDAKLDMYCKRLAQELRQVGISTATWRNPCKQELTWQDEVGTPFRILGTEKTLETGTVVLQDRDTTLEEELNGRDVLVTVQRMLLGAKLK